MPTECITQSLDFGAVDEQLCLWLACFQAGVLSLCYKQGFLKLKTSENVLLPFKVTSQKLKNSYNQFTEN